MGQPSFKTTKQLTDVLDALPQHHLMEYSTPRHAHKAVIHLRLPVRLQWLYVPPPVVIAVESRARDSSLW